GIEVLRMFMLGMRWVPLGCLATVATALVFAQTAAAHPGRDHGPERGRLALETVSNPRPELVSGGEVLVKVDVGRHTDPADVRIVSDGQDVTSSFHVQSDGDLLGLVTNLAIGRNRIVAFAGRRFGSSLEVIDHS